MRRAHTSGLWAVRTSRFTRFFVIPLTLLALFSGCYKWSTPSQSPVDFIREEEPSKVRLHLMDGRQLIVHDPSVTNGDISGFVNDTLRTVRSDEVSYVEHRSKSAWLGWAGFVGVFVALGLVLREVGFPWGDG